MRTRRPQPSLAETFLAELIALCENRQTGGFDNLYRSKEFDDTLAISALRSVSDSPLPYQDTRDLAVLLRLERGDPDSIREIAEAAPRLQRTSQFQRYLSSVQDLRSVAPVVLQGLRAIVEADRQPLKLRYAAANALGEVHTKDLLPLFEKLLFDRDPVFQAYGALGIGMIANGCGVSPRLSGCVFDPEAPRPSYWTPELRANQVLGFVPGYQSVQGHAQKVAFWQAWWKANSRFVLNNPRPS